MPAQSSALADDRTRPRRKGEITAERILNAAEELFAERGYAGTSLRDVADRVGLRVPSLYNHFESKDSLYAAVLARGIGPVLEILSEFAAAGSERAGDSGVVVERVMELLAAHPNLPRLVQQETVAGGQHLTPMLRDWIVPVFATAQQSLEGRTGEAGRWDPEHVPLLVLAMYNVVVGYFSIAPLYRELNGEDLLSREALARQTRMFALMVEALFPG